jgi:hypothetical protein
MPAVTAADEDATLFLPTAAVTVAAAAAGGLAAPTAAAPAPLGAPRPEVAVGAAGGSTNVGLSGCGGRGRLLESSPSKEPSNERPSTEA